MPELSDSRSEQPKASLSQITNRKPKRGAAVRSGDLSGIMVKLYKNRQSGGNGEIVVVTDAKDLRDFIPELAKATLQAIKQLEGDEEFTLNAIFSNAFDVAFKLQGYKAERVVEQKLLTCGYSSPNVCDIIADTNSQAAELLK